MRRISCMDQRMSDWLVTSEVDGACWLCAALFLGRRGRVGVNADRRHHGEGEHDERHVTTPAMPGARLVVIEAEFVLRRFETVFDRPAMSFDFRQSFDGRSPRSPCREEGEVAVGDFSPDQKAARPCLPNERLVVIAAIEIGELEIGPVVKSLAFGSRARRKTPPRGGRQAIGDLLRRSGDGLWLAPGAKRVIGLHAEHIALAGAPQRHFDIADAIDAVGGDEGEWNSGRDGALDHGARQRRLARKAARRAFDHLSRHVRLGHARRIVRPALGQIQFAVDEGVTARRDIAGEDADLTVGDLARRTRLLPRDAAGRLPLLQEPRLVDDEMLPHLDERQRRLFAAAEARAAGHGGIAVVARVTRIAASTIGRGLKDLEAPETLPLGRIRRPGGGGNHWPRRIADCSTIGVSSGRSTIFALAIFVQGIIDFVSNQSWSLEHEPRHDLHQPCNAR
jgi:hypothetical protein